MGILTSYVSSIEFVMLAPTIPRSNVSSFEANVLVHAAHRYQPNAVGSQDSGCHGVFLSQAAVSIDGQSSVFSKGLMPMIRTLMSTTACRSRLPNLIPSGSRSSFSRNIPAEVKNIKYNRDVECGPFYSKFCDAEAHRLVLERLLPE